MNHSTQCQKILELLRSRNGQWVELPAILALMIAQYGARILELRRTGHNIEVRSEWSGRSRKTWYRLLPPNPQGALFE